MGKIEGISNGDLILSAALAEALDKLNSNDCSVFSRIGGVQGLSRIVVMDDREIKRSHRNIGPKTIAIIHEVRRAIMEEVAESAKQELKKKGNWKEQD